MEEKEDEPEAEVSVGKLESGGGSRREQLEEDRDEREGEERVSVSSRGLPAAERRDSPAPSTRKTAL